MTKLYVSVDIEGVAGVVSWDQVMADRPAYEMGRRLLMDELGSLCRGAVAAGVDEIVVNDSHSAMRNIVPDQLPDHSRLITGHFKPGYMMEGIDDSFEAAVFLAYHGPAGSASTLSHTYNPRVVWEARLNGEVTGEAGINALVAHHFGVPVVLITGDDTTVRDAERWIPEATGVEVKRSLGRFSADSKSPAEANRLIFEGMQTALSAINPPPRPEKSPILEVVLQSEEMAAICEWAQAADRTGARTVSISGTNGLELYRKFHVALMLARTVADV